MNALGVGGLTIKKDFNLLIFVSSWALCFWAICKAFQLPMGHDESLSYAIFNWYPGLAKTANNHFVVTAYMRFAAKVFGANEFVLRSVSVFSYSGFVFASALLAKRFAFSLTGVSFWLMLNSSALVLNYSVLARGYSFSTAFSLFGFYLLCKSLDVGSRARGLLLAAAALCFSLASLSILSFVYLIPSVIVIIFIIAFTASDWGGRPASSAFTLVVLPCCFFSATLIINLIKARELKSLGELYFGTDQGVVFGTFKSLLDSQGLDAAFSTTFAVLLGFISLASVVSSGRIVLHRCRRRVRITPRELSSLFLGITVVSTTLVSLVSGSLYPVGRVAMYLILPVTLYSFFVFDRLAEIIRCKYGNGFANYLLSVLLLCSVVVASIGASREIDSITLARESNPSKEVVSFLVRDIGKLPGEQVFSLGAFWGLEPSLNFYRVTGGVDRLQHVSRKKYGQEKFDYIYDRGSDFAPLSSEEFQRNYEPIAKGPSEGLPLDGAIYRLIRNR